MITLLAGVLAVAMVGLSATAAGVRCKLPASQMLLPTISAVVVWLWLFGMMGQLFVGGVLLYALLTAFVVYTAVSHQQSIWEQLKQPAMVLFLGISFAFLVLFFFTQPRFIQNDEFTLWGTAAKLTCTQNVLHPAAEGNLMAYGAMPGMMLLVYFFQFLAPGFTEWAAYAAYNSLLAASVVTMAGVRARRWYQTVLLVALGGLLGYFFTAPQVGGLSTVYLSLLGDLPLGMVFGGVVCLYLGTEKHMLQPVLLAVSFCFLTLIKDMGLAYACIAAGIIWLHQIVTAERYKWGRKFALSSGITVGYLVLIAGTYLGWSRYVAMVTGADKGSIGSDETQTDLVSAMLSGVLQLLGLEPATEKFQQVSALMLPSPLTVPICLLGAGIWALALILVVFAAAAFTGDKKQRLGVASIASMAVLGLVAFLVFHLFLYVFNFKTPEALELKDYIRYISPYYLGMFLMALGLLAHSREHWLNQGLAVLLVAGMAVLFVWRGAPTAGFWNYPQVAYSQRDDVTQRAHQVNALLQPEDTVLLISQGDDVTRWNYYGYELNATLARGFGGIGYAEELNQGTDWWMTTHMNLVSPEMADQQVYPYQTVCTAEDLKRFLLDTRYTHILVDESDAYIAQQIAPAFGIDTLPDARTSQVYLLRVVYEGDAVHWVWEGGLEE